MIMILKKKLLVINIYIQEWSLCLLFLIFICIVYYFKFPNTLLLFNFFVLLPL